MAMAMAIAVGAATRQVRSLVLAAGGHGTSDADGKGYRREALSRRNVQAAGGLDSGRRVSQMER
jgi:hypothetical protein